MHVESDRLLEWPEIPPRRAGRRLSRFQGGTTTRSCGLSARAARQEAEGSPSWTVPERLRCLVAKLNEWLRAFQVFRLRQRDLKIAGAIVPNVGDITRKTIL